MKPLRAKLTVQKLEKRNMPATFVVSNLNDSGAGSIRQAILEANANSGADTVQIQAGLTGTVVLTNGTLVISDPVTIQGTGNAQTAFFTVGTNKNGRAMLINAATTLVGVACSGSSATGAVSPGLGGGILSNAPLTLIDCGLGGNTATVGGGGIYQTGPTLSLVRCQIAGNYSGSTGGGGILATGIVTLHACQLLSNGAVSGGGIYLTSGSLSLDSSSIDGNVGTNGAAVRCDGGFFARNCNFSGNGSSINGAKGGALYLTGGGTLWNCTVAYNGFKSNFGTGGGIYGDVALESCIVSNNSASAGPDIAGAVTAKYSLIGSSSGITSFTDEGNNLAFGVDPQFTSTIGGGNGGTIDTLPLLATSPCKDKGSNPAGSPYDARGFMHDRSSGAAPDMGAYEIQPPIKVTFQLNVVAGLQRSRIGELLVTFDAGFLSANSSIINSLQLRRVSDNAVVTLVFGVEGAVFTPWSRTYSFRFSSGPVQSGSLADGVYTLKVVGTSIRDEAGQYLDGNGDGIGGDDYVSPTTPGDPNRIFRLFGDINGDATVDLADFLAFRGAIGSDSTALNWNWAFDANNDGKIDLQDFLAFRQRFGTTI